VAQKKRPHRQELLRLLERGAAALDLLRGRGGPRLPAPAHAVDHVGGFATHVHGRLLEVGRHVLQIFVADLALIDEPVGERVVRQSVLHDAEAEHPGELPEGVEDHDVGNVSS
jgi:hypothetical protein